jgi:enoyl-CoA hydratase/carnithine racemase
LSVSSSSVRAGDDDEGRSLVSVERSEHVATVTLQRPAVLNAISGRVADELSSALISLSTDESVWVVVLTGAGDRAFCVGADLKERAAFSPVDFRRNRVQIRRMFAALRGVPQPTVASVFGFALGGGFELALSCDVSVASEDAELGLTEARVGLLPGGGGTQLLARAVGPAKAKELIFTAARLPARAAAELGLVNRVVARSELHAATDALARSICSSSPVAVRAAKRVVDASGGLALVNGLDLEHAAWSLVIASDDRAEGIASFNDKRAPRWTNR